MYRTVSCQLSNFLNTQFVNQAQAIDKWRHLKTTVTNYEKVNALLEIWDILLPCVQTSDLFTAYFHQNRVRCASKLKTREKWKVDILFFHRQTKACKEKNKLIKRRGVVLYTVNIFYNMKTEKSISSLFPARSANTHAISACRLGASWLGASWLSLTRPAVWTRSYAVPRFLNGLEAL